MWIDPNKILEDWKLWAMKCKLLRKKKKADIQGGMMFKVFTGGVLDWKGIERSEWKRRPATEIFSVFHVFVERK